MTGAQRAAVRIAFLSLLLAASSLLPARVPAADAAGPPAEFALGPLVAPVDGSGCLNLVLAVVCAGGGSPAQPFGATCNPYTTCSLNNQSPGVTPLGSSMSNCAGFSVGVVQPGCAGPSSINAPGSQTVGAPSTGGPPPLLTKSCPGYTQLFPVAQNCPTQLPSAAGSSGSQSSSGPSVDSSSAGAGLSQPSGAGSAGAITPTTDCYLGTDQNPHSLTAADCFKQNGSLIPPLGAPSSSTSNNGSSASAGASGAGVSCYLGSNATPTSMTAVDCFNGGGSLVPPLDPTAGAASGDTTSGATP